MTAIIIYSHIMLAIAVTSLYIFGPKINCAAAGTLV